MFRAINLFIPLLLVATFNNIVYAQNDKQKYEVIRPAQSTQTGDKIEVLEVFSYACSHCNSLDPYIDKWMETKPAHVEFRRMPVLFNNTYFVLAKAYYSIEKMGVLDKVHKPLFDAIHRQKLKFFSEKELRKFFVKLGIDSDKFTRIYNSNEIDIKVKQADTMVKKYGVSLVPTFIVNGRYLTHSGLTDSNEGTLEVVNQLIEIESKQE